jgi:hypothetical protein
MVGLSETMFDADSLGANALGGAALARADLDMVGLGGYDVDASQEADLQVTAQGGTAIGETRREEPEREEPDLQEPEREEPEQEDSRNPAEVPAAATELTSSYDHLWDKTVMRSIEDAAIRTGEDHDGGPQTASASPESRKESERAHEDAAGDATDQSTAGPGIQGTDSPAKDGTAPHRGGAQSDGRREPEGREERGSGGMTSGGLIDSVPWATGGNRGAGPSAPPSFISLPDSRPAWMTPQSEQNQPAQNQPTQSQPVQSQPAQNRAASAPAGAPALPYLADGDHDGQTVFKSDLMDASAQPQAAPGAPPGVMPGDGPRVLARVCGSGHANPPTSGQCSTCGALLPDVAVQVPRPRLGRVRLSTGEVIELEESLVIGRQPSVSRVQGGAMPRLVQVASPGGDISRSHVEVRLEGWHVMLCDLKATNGTVLVRAGQPPRRLAQNEMAIVLDGDIAELGDDVSLRFEEIL